MTSSMHSTTTTTNNYIDFVVVDQNKNEKCARTTNQRTTLPPALVPALLDWYELTKEVRAADQPNRNEKCVQKKKVRGENAHGPTKNEKCARGGTTTTEREARAEQRTKNAVKHLRKMSYWKRVEAVGWWCGGMEYFLHGGSKGTTKSQLRRLISNFFFIFIDELITALISKKWFHIMMHVDRLYKNFTQ